MSSAPSPQVTRTPTVGSGTLNEQQPPPEEQPAGKGLQFWLVFISLMVATFVSALDITAVSTALPTIVSKLHGREFVWVGSAYTLASTAFLPSSGGLAQIFGRKPVMVGFLLLFLLGSGLCGGAHSMDMLIAGRTVQGIGSGGILSLTEIIIADLVPLAERGAYMGFIGAVWAVACAAGPPIGGALAEKQWRWLFYLNVPLTAVATVLVLIFLQVKAPKDDLRSKFARMDWTGNALVIAATTSTIIALTWGGVKYPWDSARVLVPLILGLAGLVAFFLYEGKFPREPVVPWELFSYRTSFSGFLSTFWHGIVVAAVTFYIPVYFQATKLNSPVHSGVNFLATATTIAPGAIAAGATTTIFKKYRPQNYIGWLLCCLGTGLLHLLTADASKARYIAVQVPIGVGMGFLFTATTFPILAPLPLKEIAHALAQLAFLRNFAFTWGTTIGSTVLQNQLKKKLPADYLAQVSSGNSGNEIAYLIIPSIPGLQEPLQTQVRVAFAESLQTLWWVMLGISVVGLATTTLQKEIPMQETTDDQWGMEEKAAKKDEEKALEEKKTAAAGGEISD